MDGDACKGESGGPLFCNNGQECSKFGIKYLVGAVHYGESCEVYERSPNLGHYNVGFYSKTYTNRIYDWINNIIESNENSHISSWTSYFSG